LIAAGRASSEAQTDAAPEWRTEVSRRLEQYRTRRHRVAPDVQSGLPFRKAPGSQPARVPSEPQTASPTRERHVERTVTRARQTERVEICVQPELDFSAAARERSRPQTALVPVASIEERLRASAIDGVFLALTCAAFAGLFRSLGGEIAISKMDALVSAAVIYLFYSLYLCLFTTLAGATPGMQLRGLSIVRLDGTLPDTSQLLWRSFGYLLSGATLAFGFLWALWDEDRFTWQDRISQTYVTAVDPLSEGHAFDLPRSRRTFAHK
jgi:uncharacterized RDD family membrane protein YckC